MLVVVFLFFQKLMRQTTALELVNWADQHEMGSARGSCDGGDEK